MANMICPTCSRKYKGLARFCSDCGVELEKDKNRCSEMRTTLCRDMQLADEDTFCRYCGALTEYAKLRQVQEEI